MQRQFRLGGGVAPKTTRLRGQSIIEYVLIAAIIGLVIVFAGPQVSGAIRNQFNLVGNTVDSGANGGTEGGTAGGGSNGTDSATVQAAVAKDTKDWTLDEQKAAATDIAKNGTSSVVYAKAKAAMDAGTKFSMKLTDGQTLEYKIIGINHDDLADGSGKAGLTFLTTSANIKSRMNPTSTNVGGWEKSELRQKMNSGEIWNLMPSEFQSKVKSVRKLTNNVSGEDEHAKVTATTDKLFLLSGAEIVESPYISSFLNFPWIYREGTQYEAFKGKVMNNHSRNDYLKSSKEWWQRSASVNDSVAFRFISTDGEPTWDSNASQSQDVCPAWCF